MSFVGRAVHSVLLRFIFEEADGGVVFCSITHSPNLNPNVAFSDFAMSRFHATPHLLQQASVVTNIPRLLEFRCTSTHSTKLTKVWSQQRYTILLCCDITSAFPDLFQSVCPFSLLIAHFTVCHSCHLSSKPTKKKKTQKDLVLP